MTLPTSRLAYTDCQELFDKALDSGKGIRVAQADYETAFHMRTRMHYFRKIDREDNLTVHDEGHNLYGRSIYDVLVCKIKNIEGEFYLYIEKRQVNDEDIEDLDDLEGAA